MSYWPTNTTIISGSVGIRQDVIADALNSLSGSGLGASGSFIGTGVSTLGVAGLQVSLYADQNCYVYIEQSPNNINWDISDLFDYRVTGTGFGITVQAVSSYYRVVVVNNSSSATTIFRLQSALCPIVESMPRSLNSYGRLKTSTGIVDEETGARVEIDPLGGLKTVTPIRLVGTSFSGSTVDSNFWTTYVSASGSVTQNGEIILATGTSASAISRITSVRKARKVPGATNQFRTVIRHITAPETNNIRRIGAYDDNDGFFFVLNGATLGVGSRKAGVDTVVSSGSFNGNYGKSVVVNTVLRRLTINFSSVSAKFFIDDILLHTLSNTSSLAPTSTLTLPVRAENYNISTNTTNHSVEIRFMCIMRLGELITNPQYKFINTDSTNILKYSAGTLQNVINVDNAGVINIYDSIGTAGSSGSTIAVIDAAKALGGFTFNAPFSTGLTIVTTGGAKVTVTYE